MDRPQSPDSARSSLAKTRGLRTHFFNFEKGTDREKGGADLGPGRFGDSGPALYGSTGSIVSADASSVPGGAWYADDLPFAMDEPEDLKTYMRKVDDAPPELEMFSLPANRAVDQIERLEAELSASAVELQQFESTLSAGYDGSGHGYGE